MTTVLARSEAAGTVRRVATLFAIAFVVVVAVLALLGQLGLSDTALGVILTGATLITFVVIGVNARTMHTSEFYVAGRAVPRVANGMASAAAFTSGAVFLGLAGVFFADERAALALTIGWSFGFLMLAVLFAPYFRKSGAYGVADFLAIRYGSGAVRLIAVTIVALSLIAALAAALATAALIGTAMFGISSGGAVVTAALIVLACTLLGGMQAVTMAGIIQFIAAALALLAPVAFVSASDFSLPIPQLTFGHAAAQAAALGAAGGQLAPSLAGRFLPFAPTSGFGFFAAIVSLATGVAALPHLLVRSATVRDVEAARWSAGWSLIFVLVIALTAPAYAAFAKLAILRQVVGSVVDALPDWIFVFGKLGLVQICGADAVSPAVISAACGTSGPIFAPQLAVNGDAIVLAWPHIVGLPYISSVLVAVGALAATLAAAGAIAFAVGGSLGHDLYARLFAIKASAGRQLAMTRLLLIAVVALGAWLAASRRDDAFALALTAISLSAGGLFPALFAAIWWRRSNAPGVVAGMVTGFVATAAIVVACRYPGLLPPGFVAPHAWGLSELSAAIVGLPVGFAVIAVVSLLTAAPSAKRLIVLDAIRRPGGRPFVQEGES